MSKPVKTTVMVAMKGDYFLQTQGLCCDGLCLVRPKNYLKGADPEKYSIIHHGSGRNVVVIIGLTKAKATIRELLKMDVNWQASSSNIQKTIDRKELHSRLNPDETI